jgi:hypothetical protein
LIYIISSVVRLFNVSHVRLKYLKYLLQKIQYVMEALN